MKQLPLLWAAWSRKPVETCLTWCAVSVAFILFGMMAGLNRAYRHALDAARMDRLYVTPRFPSVDTGRGANGFPLEVGAQLARVQGVSGVGGFRAVPAYRSDPHNRVFIYAVTEGMRLGWSELPITSNQWDRLFAQPDGILVSRKAANNWNLKRGDSFPVIATADEREDGSHTWIFQVVDVVEGEDPEWANGFIIGNFSYLDDALPPLARSVVRGFRVSLTDGDRAFSVADRIDRAFANSATPTLSIPAKTNAQNLANSDVAVASMSWAVAGSGLFMILFLVGNGIAQSVRERLPEFAVLRSLGFQMTQLFALILAEALIPCVSAALFGTALTFALTFIPLHFLPRSLAGLPAPSISPIVFLWAVMVAVLLSCVSAAFPVNRLRSVSISGVLSGR